MDVIRRKQYDMIMVSRGSAFITDGDQRMRHGDPNVLLSLLFPPRTLVAVGTHFLSNLRDLGFSLSGNEKTQ